MPYIPQIKVGGTIYDLYDKRVDDLRSAIMNYNAFDFWSYMISPESTEDRNSIVFKINSDDSIYVHIKSGASQATNNTFRTMYDNSESLPYGLIAGGKYRLKYNASTTYFRIYWYVNGTAILAIETLGDLEFTVPDNATGALIRMFVYKNSTPNETVRPIIINCFTNQELSENGNLNVKTIPENADFNNYTEPGYYDLSAATAKAQTYLNDPITPGNYGMLAVYKTGFVYQIGYDFLTGISYFRVYAHSSWTEWIEVKDSLKVVSSGSLSDTDMNNYRGKNFYCVLGYNSDFQHSPIPKRHRRLWFSLDTAQLMIDIESGEMYQRTYFDGSWGEWNGRDTGNHKYSYFQSASDSESQNIGYRYKVMSYNVANYNNDTAIKLPIDKEFNLKKLINEVNADIVGIQEDQPYIDSDSEKDSVAYLWKPMYPIKSGSGGPCIHTRQVITGTGIVQFSNESRYIRYVTITVNNKTMLFVSTHPSVDSSKREQQYTELFKWVYWKITLNTENTQTPAYCPKWDYCIIAGDFNSATSTDLDNLKSLAEQYHFTMANGGYLGWLTTCVSSSGKYSLDNIICSSNIIINKTMVYSQLYNELYSDHYPVTAEVMLLNEDPLPAPEDE